MGAGCQKDRTIDSVKYVKNPKAPPSLPKRKLRERSASMIMEFERELEPRYKNIPNKFFPRFNLQGEPTGISGFENMGNTSFITVILHMMFAVQPLTDYFLNRLFVRERTKFQVMGHKSDVIKNYFFLLKEYWTSKMKIIKIKTFYEAIVAEMPQVNDLFMLISQFNTKKEQDAQEFLDELLYVLFEELNRAPDIVGKDEDDGIDPEEPRPENFYLLTEERVEVIDPEQEKRKKKKEKELEKRRKKEEKERKKAEKKGKKKGETEEKEVPSDDQQEEENRESTGGSSDESPTRVKKTQEERKTGGRKFKVNKDKDGEEEEENDPQQFDIEGESKLLRKISSDDGELDQTKVEDENNEEQEEQEEEDSPQLNSKKRSSVQKQSMTKLKKKKEKSKFEEEIERDEDESESEQLSTTKKVKTVGKLKIKKNGISDDEENGDLSEIQIKDETKNKSNKKDRGQIESTTIIQNEANKKKGNEESKKTEKKDDASKVSAKKKEEEKKLKEKEEEERRLEEELGIPKFDEYKLKYKLPPPRKKKAGHNHPFIRAALESEITLAEKGRNEWIKLMIDNASIMLDLFQGQLKITTKCLNCDKESNNFEHFSYLSIAVPKVQDVKLTDCLYDMIKTERFGHAEKWNCSTCDQRSKSLKRNDFLVFPNILILHLSRFEKDEDGSTMKINTLIRFPLDELDMTPFSAVPQLGKPTYRLFGFVEHDGLLENGHYTAVVRHQMDGKWYYFDDESVSLVLETDSQKSLEDALVTPRAYILFYAKATVPTFFRQSLSDFLQWPFDEVEIQKLYIIKENILNPIEELKKEQQYREWLEKENKKRKKVIPLQPSQAKKTIEDKPLVDEFIPMGVETNQQNQAMMIGPEKIQIDENSNLADAELSKFKLISRGYGIKQTDKKTIRDKYNEAKVEQNEVLNIILKHTTPAVSKQVKEEPVNDAKINQQPIQSIQNQQKQQNTKQEIVDLAKSQEKSQEAPKIKSFKDSMPLQKNYVSVFDNVSKNPRRFDDRSILKAQRDQGDLNSYPAPNFSISPEKKKSDGLNTRSETEKSDESNFIKIKKLGM